MKTSTDCLYCLFVGVEYKRDDAMVDANGNTPFVVKYGNAETPVYRIGTGLFSEWKPCEHCVIDENA